MYMNQWDIEEAVEQHRRHPVLGKAARFLQAFAREVDAHSDGWMYWRQPVNAARQLIALLQPYRYQRPFDKPLPEPTERDYVKALAPIKSFMTRRGLAAGMTMPDTQSKP